MNGALRRIEAQLDRNLSRDIADSVIVQPILGLKIPSRHRSKLRTHQSLGVVQQLFDQAEELRLAIFLPKLEHSPLTHSTGADLRLQIAFALPGGANIQQDQV